MGSALGDDAVRMCGATFSYKAMSLQHLTCRVKPNAKRRRHFAPDDEIGVGSPHESACPIYQRADGRLPCKRLVSDFVVPNLRPVIKPPRSLPGASRGRQELSRRRPPKRDPRQLRSAGPARYASAMTTYRPLRRTDVSASCGLSVERRAEVAALRSLSCATRTYITYYICFLKRRISGIQPRNASER